MQDPVLGNLTLTFSVPGQIDTPDNQCSILISPSYIDFFVSDCFYAPQKSMQILILTVVH